MSANTESDKNNFNVVELDFLENHIKKKVNIFLINGTKLSAEILAYDENTIVATQASDKKAKVQLIYKTAIATVAEI